MTDIIAHLNQRGNTIQWAQNQNFSVMGGWWGESFLKQSCHRLKIKYRSIIRHALSWKWSRRSLSCKLSTSVNAAKNGHCSLYNTSINTPQPGLDFKRWYIFKSCRLFLEITFNAVSAGFLCLFCFPRFVIIFFKKRNVHSSPKIKDPSACNFVTEPCDLLRPALLVNSILLMKLKSAAQQHPESNRQFPAF